MGNGASCHVNDFSPEQLPPGETENWKKCMFWLYVSEKLWPPAALNPGRKFIMWVYRKEEEKITSSILLLSGPALGILILSLSRMVISDLAPKVRKSWTEKTIWIPSSILWGLLCVQLLVL